MKKLFENWRKNFNEAAFEPGRATGDIGTSMGSPDAMPEEDAKRHELNEMLSDEPNAPVNRMSFEDENYEYNKNMFYTQIYQALDQFVEKSGGRFDKSMRMRILKGIAKVLGDRK